MESVNDWKEFVDELKTQWSTLWRDRIDDRERAEGIANQDYSLLFVEQGLVVIATRDYAYLDFFDILQQHQLSSSTEGARAIPPVPSVGGWGKFIRNVVNKQKRLTRRGRPVPPEPKRKRQQLKKGGRGWLHR